MKFPDVQHFNDPKELFRHFVAENKQASAHSSYRFLSKRLRWPVSYLNDVINGRKRLTVRRALEFAAFFKLDEDATDHMVLMALHDSHTGEAKTYFAKKLAAHQQE